MNVLQNSVLKGNVSQVIMGFLDPIDIWRYHQTFHINKQISYAIFKRRVMEKIDDWFKEFFGERYNEFRQIMVDTACIVSGSFIIQVILGETWEGSDVDIFMGMDSHKTVGHEIPYESNVSLLDYFLYTFDGTFCSVGNGATYTSEFGNPLHRTQTYNYKNKDINTVSLLLHSNIQTIGDHIYDYFDFDICKNLLYYSNDGMHLNIHSVNQILTKKTECKFGKSRDAPNKLLARYRKYKNRGFAFTPDDPEALLRIASDVSFRVLCLNSVKGGDVFRIDDRDVFRFGEMLGSLPIDIKHINDGCIITINTTTRHIKPTCYIKDECVNVVPNHTTARLCREKSCNINNVYGDITHWHYWLHFNDMPIQILTFYIV
jgi:hypothetical protein